jgi:phage/plasmid-associated DNA primase
MSGFLQFDPDRLSFEHVPHSPDQLSRNKLPVAYDATATCRNFRRLLVRAFGGDQLKAQAFTEFLACAIFRQMPANDGSRTCFLMVGPQRSGKSTIIRLSQLFFVEEQTTSLAPIYGANQRTCCSLSAAC